MSRLQRIAIFEHQTLIAGRFYLGVEFTASHLKSLQKYYGEKGKPYFSLVNSGVKFCEYVGVMQVGNLVIEVLPKAGKNADTNVWQTTLIDMLKAVGDLEIKTPGLSALKLKNTSILDLYIELFLVEVELLIFHGLIKQYRKAEGNMNSLKGAILFPKQIKHNRVHQERFFVKYNTYDQLHTIHSIIYKTLKLLKVVNTKGLLSSRINSVLLNFPEQREIFVNENVFSKLPTNRKTARYDAALMISKLLLLNYHPDVTEGRNNVLALMFDMNALWEKFVYKSILRCNADGYFEEVSAQKQKDFWKPFTGSVSTMVPDIVLRSSTGESFVLDTKWKNLEDKNPSSEDLRQMYVYHEYYKAKRVALVYPGEDLLKRTGKFLPTDAKVESDKECSVFPLKVNSNVRAWQVEIGKIVMEWATINN